MDQELAKNPTASGLSGSVEAATGNSGTAGVSQTATNFLFTFLPPTPPLSGTRDETDGVQTAGQVLAGTYVVNGDTSGSITLTQPGAEKYVIYVLDNPKSSANMIQHFVMINVDPANANPAVIFGER